MPVDIGWRRRPKTGSTGTLDSVFERMSDQGRRVLVLAQEEARRLGHGFIGTEHILLGLLGDDVGIAADALQALEISHDAVLAKVEETIGSTGTAPTGSPAFTTRAKKVLELSMRESIQLGAVTIGTEHLLLGVVREGEGVAAQILQSLGADPPRTRQLVVRLLAAQHSDRPTEQGHSEPSCPHCRSLLAHEARYRTITVTPDEPGPDRDSRSVDLIFCGRCGTTVGIVTSDR